MSCLLPFRDIVSVFPEGFKRFFFFRAGDPNTIPAAMDTARGVKDNAQPSRRSRLPAIACTIAIVVLSLWPKPPQPSEVFRFLHADKVAHVLMYGVYVVLLARTYRPGRMTWRFGAGLVIYACVFGVLMEILQGVIPALVRGFSFLDMLANGIGSVAGVTIHAAVCRSSRQGCAGKGDAPQV